MQQIQLGLKENWKQFTLLVIINGFVGGMVGLERSILPQIAEQEFAIAAKTAILSFIIVFGIVKAITNYYTGTLANKFGRKNLLIAGWVIGLPVPFMLMFAPTWGWVIAANVLLGINQGLAWSSTVVMKIDLVGEKQRGFAMGLNEFAGYIAVALVAFLTGWIAGEYGIRPYPFYTGIVLAVLGLLSSIFLIRDTRHHVTQEAATNNIPRLKNIFWDTTWKNKNLGSVTQAGLINNLNDGMAWGIFPIVLAGKGFSIAEIGIVTAVYPAVWGLGQLVTGAMADKFCKKDMLYTGMLLQAIALVLLIWASTMLQYVLLSAILGWGTAMVYPTFLATVAENTHPQDRAKSIGIFRLWRDLGYAVGAILTGIIADLLNVETAIGFIGILTFISAIIIRYRMHCVNGGGLKIRTWLKKSVTNRNVIVGKVNSCTSFVLK
ncbi:putative MFS family arabinose efflux permease [Lacibacter cauensis]|uniref:Putative MFS family arabinose efflux permease n=1 Tax=Lacibacter cauensis TaxID=510947 RepID=A0A562SFX3_9BACT|nr:MFS transporter [Lacibacter cauensis]TWI80192.1 putative MFS family arabinose efflux permease [Lacibacter cauensis]